jgi:hypothetical protein
MSPILLRVIVFMATDLLVSAVEAGQALFSCVLPSAALVVEGNLSYSYSVLGQRWLERGDVVAHFNGTYASASTGTLVPVKTQLGAGADNYGAFTSLQIDWTSSVIPYAITTLFKCFDSTQQPHVAFQTIFPSGASGALGTSAEDSAQGAPNGYNFSAAPITHFPSWAADANVFLNSGVLSHIEWAG